MALRLTSGRRVFESRIIERRTMGDELSKISEKLRLFIESQQVFFVATAPSGSGGHVNCSPKGDSQTLKILDESTLAYLDITGSGSETIAHLKENGRIVIMWCSFGEKPMTVRVHGKGRVHLLGEADFESHLTPFPPRLGTRAVIEVSVERVSSSCGFGVPIMETVKERPDMTDWCKKKGEEKLVDYRRRKNAKSIDGLDSFSI